MKTFEHVASEIGAEEAEEVGVEHLLRLGKKILILHIQLHYFPQSMLSELNSMSFMS